MENLNILFSRFSKITVVTAIFVMNDLSGQGNCLVYPAESDERIACELSYRALEYTQGCHDSQVLFDKAIEIAPNYAWAYYEKSVPFFKRGLVAEGVSLINEAIDLEPKNYLYYRAYWYFYNRSYALCIRDLEELYVTHKKSYTTTPGGEMEMRLILAMAYAQTGNVSKGIDWIQQLMESYKDLPHLKGLYDHYCLGVLYYHDAMYTAAIAEFQKQILFNPHFADSYYWMGLISEKRGQESEAEGYFREALVKMKSRDEGYSINIFDGFNVFKEDVEQLLVR